MRNRVRERAGLMFRLSAKRGKGGYALFFVLSLVLLMSLLLTGLTRDSRGQIMASQRALKVAQTRAETETALSFSVMRLLAAKPEERWSADGTTRLLELGETEWRVTLTPEGGKVDINHAPASLLTELFTAAGISADAAQMLADRVADWRDADDLTHTNGAERRDYESADLPPPRNGPFLRVSELRRVMGITDDLYSCIAGAITVYSGKAGIDRRFAPELLRPKAGEADMGKSAATLAQSPLAIESVAGKAIAVRLERKSGKEEERAQVRVIRITDQPASPWWLLSSHADSVLIRPRTGCVSGPPHRSEDEKDTKKG